METGIQRARRRRSVIDTARVLYASSGRTGLGYTEDEEVKEPTRVKTYQAFTHKFEFNPIFSASSEDLRAIESLKEIPQVPGFVQTSTHEFDVEPPLATGQTVAREFEIITWRSLALDLLLDPIPLPGVQLMLRTAFPVPLHMQPIRT